MVGLVNSPATNFQVWNRLGWFFLREREKIPPETAWFQQLLWNIQMKCFVLKCSHPKLRGGWKFLNI